MNNERESLVQKGSLAAWSTVADTKTQPRPRIYLPLGVEPSKPRLIWDARYLNSICKHSPLSDGRSNLSSIAVSKRSGLRFEMERWLEVRSRLNGAPWYDATRHVLTISGATDASSQARGGLIRGPFGAFSAFKAATDFPAARHNAHINVKETFALHEVPKLVTTTRPGGLKGSTTVVNADHKRCTMPLRKGVHGTRRPTTLLRNSSGCKLKKTSPRSSAGYAQRRTGRPTV